MPISPAYAQGAGGDIFTGLIPLVLIFVVFYFLLIRPQQKKVKQHREMLTAIRRGDRIVTGGGIIGTVARVVGEDELQVDITDSVRVRVVRSTVANVLQRGEPAPAEEPAEGEKPKSGKRQRREKAAPAEAKAEPAAPAAEPTAPPEPAPAAAEEPAVGADKPGGEGR
ncbi:MAG: preprotein translocase subunit YajC [Proteobacteria bacterium]|nr:preprotein translocase subunit YajC [Pseudomonadota bacterium]